MKIFIDTNIILDFLLKRKSKSNIKDLYILFKNLEIWKIKWVTSDICISTAIYFLQKCKIPLDDIRKSMYIILEKILICNASKTILLKALSNPNFKDLEDSIQHQIALENDCKYIITNNTDDFQNSTIPALTPTEFISLINHKND